MRRNASRKRLKKLLKSLQSQAFKYGLETIVFQYNYVSNYPAPIPKKKSRKGLILGVVVLFLGLVVSGDLVNIFLSTRCLFPSNFLVWEATRPLADCDYCRNVYKPVILWNITRREFVQYAYSAGPIIVKNAIKHWKAMNKFSYKMFKDLYEETANSYESLDDGCQFLNFKSDLFSLKEIFSMSEERARNDKGQEPWYVGWGNCHPEILAKVRQYYDVPHFLPHDAELPATENIFFGYEIGAVMHLDYISRIMWQGQVKGNKTWSVAPVPECELECQKFNFYVEAGDIVSMDTRLWYHETRIAKGEFSLTVQSEYG